MEEQVGCWGIVKKNTDPPQIGVPGGNLVVFNPRIIVRSKLYGKARTVRSGGKRKVQGVGGLFGNWVKGLPSPCWDSPQPLRSGRKGAACNPHGQVWGCQMLRAGGWRGLTKACPPGRSQRYPPASLPECSGP